MRSYTIVREFLARNWRMMLEFLVLVGVSFGTLQYRLGSLVSLASNQEVEALSRSSNWHLIIQDPLHAVYELPQFGLVLLNVGGIQAARFVSVMFGVASICLLYYVLVSWVARPVAIIGTLAALSSSWFIATSRLALPDNAYIFLCLASLAYGVWMSSSKRTTLSVALGVLLVTALVYTPGMIWLVVAALVWRRRQLGQLVQRTKQFSVIALVCLGALLLPLLVSTLRDPQLLWQVFGLEEPLLTNIIHLPGEFLRTLQSIGWRDQGNALLGITRLPLLDASSVILGLIGLYDAIAHFGLDRTRLVLSGLTLSVVLASLGRAVPVAMALPFVYVLITFGINRLLRDWYHVFPRNPIARSVGIGLLSLCIAVAGVYHIGRYFVAWPKTIETKRAFSSTY